uniref:Polyamine-modulated factor 1-like n=1 Tax=Salarias fasciatus TaxID=181472 RepID=A0A672IT31_SALFA
VLPVAGQVRDRVAKMEESKDTTQNEAANNVISSQMSAGKPSEKTEPRFNRLKLFDKVIQKSMNKFIDFNRFASMFRPLYKENPQRMERIHEQFIEDLQKSIQEDISKLIEEGRLELKLNELDKLESAAKSNPSPAWRPTGVPEKDFCSFLVPYYQKQEAYMLLKLKKIKAENAALAQKVQAGRDSITQTEHSISAAVDEWKVRGKASVTEFETLAASLQPADVFDV